MTDNEPQQAVPNPGLTSPDSKEIVFWIALFLIMIIGMIAKSLVDYLQTGRDVKISLEVIFDSEMLMPLLISPMVFGVIYGIVKQSPQKNLGSFLFAFQNGFFWKAIFQSSGEYEQ